MNGIMKGSDGGKDEGIYIPVFLKCAKESIKTCSWEYTFKNSFNSFGQKWRK